MIPMHDQTRQRLLIAAFWLLGVLPAITLLFLAVSHRMPGHTAAEVQQLAKTIGCRIELDQLVHVRPGVVRCENVRLSDPETGQLLAACRELTVRHSGGGLFSSPKLYTVTGDLARVNAERLAECSDLLARVLTHRSGWSGPTVQLNFEQLELVDRSLLVEMVLPEYVDENQAAADPTASTASTASPASDPLFQNPAMSANDETLGDPTQSGLTQSGLTQSGLTQSGLTQSDPRCQLAVTRFKCRASTKSSRSSLDVQFMTAESTESNPVRLSIERVTSDAKTVTQFDLSSGDATLSCHRLTQLFAAHTPILNRLPPSGRDAEIRGTIHAESSPEGWAGSCICWISNLEVSHRLQQSPGYSLVSDHGRLHINATFSRGQVDQAKNSWLELQGGRVGTALLNSWANRLDAQSNASPNELTGSSMVPFSRFLVYFDMEGQLLRIKPADSSGVLMTDGPTGNRSLFSMRRSHVTGPVGMFVSDLVPKGVDGLMVSSWTAPLIGYCCLPDDRSLSLPLNTPVSPPTSSPASLPILGSSAVSSPISPAVVAETSSPYATSAAPVNAELSGGGAPIPVYPGSMPLSQLTPVAPGATRQPLFEAPAIGHTSVGQMPAGQSSTAQIPISTATTRRIQPNPNPYPMR